MNYLTCIFVKFNFSFAMNGPFQTTIPRITLYVLFAYNI